VDNYIYPWLLICLNAFLAAFLSEIMSMAMSTGVLQHWDTVSLQTTSNSMFTIFLFALKFILTIKHLVFS
jgi:hypothetical protein